MKSWLNLLRAVVIASIAVSAPVAAHHSFAAFDMARTLTLQGTIKEVQWTNPHVWVQVVVEDARGRSEEWSLEGQSVSLMRSMGWRKDVVKPGDEVIVVVSPGKQTQTRAALRAITLPDGKTIGNASGGNLPPAPAIRIEGEDQR
jgi:hypothetical protein